MTEEPENWTFEVTVSDHDAVHVGNYRQHRTRVTISRQHYPNWVTASETAATVAAARYRGMPTRVLNVY